MKFRPSPCAPCAPTRRPWPAIVRPAVRLVIIAAALAAACAPPPEQASPPGQVWDLAHFLRRLRQVDHLPLLERYRTAMSSTWDRAGGNDDGEDYKQLKGNRNRLLDVDGPGCIHRIYTGILGSDVHHTRIQIFIDHAARPLFDLPVNVFFNELHGPFPYPLTSIGTYPGTHFPIPYARHVRVDLTAPPGPKKRWGSVWQLTYSSYPKDTPVKSITWPPSAAARQELERVVGAWMVAAQLPPSPPAAGPRDLDRTLKLGPGQRGEVSLDGSGVIRRMRIKVTPNTPAVLRGLRLRVRWDGASFASVDVPLGYFFGHGDVAGAGSDFHSMVLGLYRGEAYSRLPMPFASGAVVSLVNTAKETATVRLRLAVEQLPAAPTAELGRLHATWSQQKAATAGVPTFGPQKIPGHVVLETTGRGKYVGALIHLQWPHTWSWWGEGDWLVWSDESAWPPSYHGTGSEEYFNSGWMFLVRKPMSGYVSVRPGPVAAYSFHLNDAFSFDKQIKVAQETVGSYGGETVITQQHPLWGSTAYWYALPARPSK